MKQIPLGQVLIGQAFIMNQTRYVKVALEHIQAMLSHVGLDGDKYQFNPARSVWVVERPHELCGIIRRAHRSDFCLVEVLDLDIPAPVYNQRASHVQLNVDCLEKQYPGITVFMDIDNRTPAELMARS